MSDHHKTRSQIHAVTFDQAGHAMRIDPLETERNRTEAIRWRAYQLYEQRGREDNHAMDDWLTAEAQIGALPSEDKAS